MVVAVGMQMLMLCPNSASYCASFTIHNLCTLCMCCPLFTTCVLASFLGFVQLASSVASASRVRDGGHYGEYDSMLAVPALLTDMVFLMWICEIHNRVDTSDIAHGIFFMWIWRIYFNGQCPHVDMNDTDTFLVWIYAWYVYINRYSYVPGNILLRWSTGFELGIKK